MNDLDGRQGNCFTTRGPGGYCTNPLPMRLSKKDCCCGVNMGQGWGEDCTRCPLHGEGELNLILQPILNWELFFLDEHRALCTGKPIGPPSLQEPPTQGDANQIHPGFMLVNECVLRPDICGEGQCIDTVEGYECICKPGYRKGRTQYCEGTSITNWI